MVKQSEDTFFIGERVLCYEPDPTLIKKLYPAKIVNITFDPLRNGKKPRARYWIHFIGWKKTWDWQVDRELIMKDTLENRNLKKRIDEKLHPYIQKKYKKLMPTLALGQYGDHFSSIKTKEKDKNTEQPVEIQDIGRTVPQSLKAPVASSIRIPQISFPSPLKKILDRDYDLVNNENKIPLLSATTTQNPTDNNTFTKHSPHFIVHPSGAREISPNSATCLSLTPPPANPNAPTPHAVYILETYLKTLYYNVKTRDLLGVRRASMAPHQSLKTTSSLVNSIQPGGIASQETNFKSDAHQTTPSNDSSFENNFEMCKEVMDGIRFYFDCLISLRLLYAKEKDLYSLSFNYPFLTSVNKMEKISSPPLPNQDLEADGNQVSPSSRSTTKTSECDIANTDPAIAKHRTPRNAALKAYSNLLINPPRFRQKGKRPFLPSDSANPVATTALDRPIVDRSPSRATLSEIAENLSTDSNLMGVLKSEENPKLMAPLPIRFRLHQWWNQMIKSNLVRSPTHLPNPQFNPTPSEAPNDSTSILKRPGPVMPNAHKRPINFRTHSDNKAKDGYVETLGEPPPSDYSIYLLMPLYLPSSKAAVETPSLSLPTPSANVPRFASRSSKNLLPWELIIPNPEVFPLQYQNHSPPEPRGAKRLKKNRDFGTPSPEPQFVIPLAPSKIFGFIHLLRLLAILPDILNQHNVILLYPKVFSRQLENFLQYLSQNHQTYMQSCVYVSANLIKEELLRSQHNP